MYSLLIRTKHTLCHVLQAARPKLEMELPYKMYRLVKANGTLCERIDKHPFAMSRCRLCNPRQVLCNPAKSHTSHVACVTLGKCVQA